MNDHVVFISHFMVLTSNKGYYIGRMSFNKETDGEFSLGHLNDVETMPVKRFYSTFEAANLAFENIGQYFYIETHNQFVERFKKRLAQSTVEPLKMWHRH